MSQKQRLISLDALRGFTIAAMILVNNPGSWEHVYAPLLHKAWNGLTPTDLIFPFFIFIVGVSAVLSFSGKNKTRQERKLLVKKVLWRSVKIFAVGLFLNLYPSFQFDEVRIAGVLQRIALVYLLIGIIYLFLNKRQIVFLSAFILLGYWVVMRFIPTPGFNSAMFEPGVNMAAWVDSWLLPGKMWNGNWDPEGLLSTLPAVATGLGGMMTGFLLMSQQPVINRIARLFVYAFAACVLGVVWGWFFPINKNLWTSSYVLVTGGLAAMTLAASMYLIDVKGYKKLVQPFVIFGSNAITAYVLAGLLSYLIYGVRFGNAPISASFMQFLQALGVNPKLSSMLVALLFIGLIYFPVYILYRKKIFIRL